MERVKIRQPEKFIFKTEIAIQIADINYGGHLSNDAVLRLCHEARLRFLSHHGYSEQNVEGVGLIMSDAMIQFSNQAFYGEVLQISLAIDEIKKVGFDLIMLLAKKDSHQEVAIVKTGMVFFDYTKQKIAHTPDAFKNKFNA